jgi:hypothetical protein
MLIIIIMAPPLTARSKTEKYWTLYFPIQSAAEDPREAPWYGPWNIVLQDLFQGFCPVGFHTATYPQYPLVKDIDSVDQDGDLNDSSDDGKTDEEEDDQAIISVP